MALLDDVMPFIGSAGKLVLVTQLTRAATDQLVCERVAREMASREGFTWPPTEMGQRAIWLARASSAIIGLVRTVEGK